MQLDFFNDSHNVMLRNDVILALQREDTAAVRQAWEALSKHHPEDDCLVPLLLLLVALAECSQTPFQTHADLSTQRLALQNKTTPAALQGMGVTEATPWLRRRWQALAVRAAALPYQAGHPDEHAAALWLRAQQWQAAADAVAQIESWRRIPVPLSWMLQARLPLQGVQANWGLMAELAWLAPQRLQTVVRQTTEPVLHALVARFEASFEGTGDADDLAWFPAWVLTERPALTSALTLAQAGQHTEPEQAMRTLLELLGLERQGRQREVVALRKTLRDLNGELYAAYMATR